MGKKMIMVIFGAGLGLIYLTGCATTPEPTATPEEQMTALSGADLPLAPLEEDVAFIEALPEDSLILKEVHFDFDKSDIKEGDKPLLEEIKDWMLSHPESRMMIEGHCDERGTKEYNLALGERRALGIRSYLTGLGVNPQRLYTISYGEESPLCTESIEECWARNRRGHFLIDYGEEVPPEMMVEPISPTEVKVEIEESVVVEEVVPEPKEDALKGIEKRTTRRRVIGRYHY